MTTVMFYDFCHHPGCMVTAETMPGCSTCYNNFCPDHGSTARGLCNKCMAKLERTERLTMPVAPVAPMDDKCRFCGSLGIGIPKDRYGYCKRCNDGMARNND